MRTKEEILKSDAGNEWKILEVLLDIRNLLNKKEVKKKGRPKKVKK